MKLRQKLGGLLFSAHPVCIVHRLTVADGGWLDMWTRLWHRQEATSKPQKFSVTPESRKSSCRVWVSGICTKSWGLKLSWIGSLACRIHSIILMRSSSSSYHQNVWMAETRSVDLVRRECPRPCEVTFSADGGCILCDVTRQLFKQS